MPLNQESGEIVTQDVAKLIFMGHAASRLHEKFTLMCVCINCARAAKEMRSKHETQVSLQVSWSSYRGESSQEGLKCGQHRSANTRT